MHYSNPGVVYAEITEGQYLLKNSREAEGIRGNGDTEKKEPR
jgi:hypothetical protein